jgi:tRNA(fMet)-specific endonuclease VapC
MILDTNGLSALMGLNKAFLKRFARVPRWCLSVAVLGEYRYGLLRSRDRVALEAAIDELERTQQVLPIRATTARHYAEIRETLRIKGRPIPVNDLWIAAQGREQGLPVVTRDSHFQQVEGLEVVIW